MDVLPSSDMACVALMMRSSSHRPDNWTRRYSSCWVAPDDISGYADAAPESMSYGCDDGDRIEGMTRVEPIALINDFAVFTESQLSLGSPRIYRVS